MSITADPRWFWYKAYVVVEHYINSLKYYFPIKIAENISDAMTKSFSMYLILKYANLI